LVNNSGELNVVIVNAAGLARTYYEGNYDPDNPVPPVCWSNDTRAPAPEVPEENRKAARCADCEMNIKGSGQGDTRACRFSQRLAVVLEGDLETVYQLQVPAASIFGEAKGNNMGLQAYVRFLTAHNTPAIAVVTKLRFDENSDAPKLYFSAVRPLDENELRIVLKQRESEDALKAITMTVAQVDNVKPVEKPKSDTTKSALKPAPKRVEVEPDDDEVSEPTKVEKVKPSTGKVVSNLKDVLSAWDDD
jgi:hypothetical protein